MEILSHLPVVNPQVGYSLQYELDGVGDDEGYLDEQLERLDSDNPTIAVWIRHYSARTEDPTGSAYCALLVYKMLESQVEANRMMEEMPLV